MKNHITVEDYKKTYHATGRILEDAESFGLFSHISESDVEKHIQAYDNADELLEVFRTVKALSKSCASPYKYVRDWFKIQFPNYKKSVVFKDGELTVAPKKAPDIIEYKQKMSKAS